MRTTINLPDDLLARLKKQAMEQGTTVTALIEESVRTSLNRRPGRPKRGRIRLTTYGRTGLQSGVDLDDGASLLDLMEQAGAADGR